ncbi:MAG: hypothetical protein OZSIB_1250 [Candidatus Ozemobacter sibiricus]|uniref:Uncharacterized protein n=1 Tax=Candidatus Ozemobacter sibiricus TaxID=2268124 RepID=A0A367ZKU9_9BACT|nr:MAG: hypothetical protein OZSIB_1250 [Candidatus Ozemobacter sibiricus]
MPGRNCNNTTIWALRKSRSAVYGREKGRGVGLSVAGASHGRPVASVIKPRYPRARTTQITTTRGREGPDKGTTDAKKGAQTGGSA